MSKEIPIIKSQKSRKATVHLLVGDGLVVLSASEDRAENQDEFFGFLPEWSSRFFQLRFGSGDHAKPMFGFLGFTLADSDTVFEVSFGTRIVGFSVVRSDTGARANDLADQRSRNQIDRNGLRKIDDGFSELGRPFLQVVSRPLIAHFGPLDLGLGHSLDIEFWKLGFRQCPTLQSTCSPRARATAALRTRSVSTLVMCRRNSLVPRMSSIGTAIARAAAAAFAIDSSFTG